MTQQERGRKAEQFLALHTDPGLFILPNAWDAASAKIYEIVGFKAVGTTSAGIAHTLGYPDGQVMSVSILECIDRVEQLTGKKLDYALLGKHLEEIRSKYQKGAIKVHITGFAKVVGDLIGGATRVALFFGDGHYTAGEVRAP